MTYLDKLNDINWKIRRKEILELDNYKCSRCGTKDETLNVHHLCYIPGREPWEYQDNQLITLCEVCHRQVHKELKLKQETKNQQGRIKDSVKFGELAKTYIEYLRNKNA